MWYDQLNKPDFLPPDSVIVMAGGCIYILLSLALFFIWDAEGNKKDKKICLYLFISGLFLNVLWVYVFFGLQSPLMACMVMIMLLAVQISTIFQSFRVSIPACVLLVPYLIMSLVIALGNYDIISMNPGLPLLVT
jgi:tryptophan-rich sensory protein